MRDEERHMYGKGSHIDVNWGGTFEGFHDHHEEHNKSGDLIEDIKKQIKIKSEELHDLKLRLKQIERDMESHSNYRNKKETKVKPKRKVIKKSKGG